MRVWDGNLQQRELLSEALSLDLSEKQMIAVVGGGGKTSFLFRLAEECRMLGKKVVLTTTTHMVQRGDFPMTVGVFRQEIQGILDREKAILVGGEDQRNPWKIAGVEEDDLKFLQEIADVVVVEADGAKMRPLKAPAEWEPVIPEGCSAVVAVAGCSGIGQTVEEICHRPERVRALLGAEEGYRITPEDVVRLACSPQGLGKDVRVPFRVLVNQVDGPEQWPHAQELAAAFRKQGVTAAFSHLRDSLAVILLAAGNSVRFGGNKLLYPVDGEPMYRRMLEKCQKLEADRKILVTQYEEVAREAEEQGFTVVRNPEPERGISSSIHLGIQAAGEAEAYLFGVCDQPYLRLATLSRLVEHYQWSGKGIAALRCGDRTGNPNIFSRKYREELLALTGDVGGKAVLRRFPEDVSFLEVEPRELMDIDVRPSE